MFNPELQIGEPLLVRASSIAVTSSYVAGTAFSMDYHNSLGILVDYDKGSETSLETRVEVSNDGGASWFQETSESVSGATITKSAAERSYSTTNNFSELLRPLRGKLVRISTKATSTSATTGSCQIQVIPLWS